uniref:Sodium/potassium-transporting ATPase subunit beta-1-interacting protein n=1 Tax=Clastoptera arizonana TaxID=38151 RepID=A0A1B6C6P1_9HEMI
MGFCTKRNLLLSTCVIQLIVTVWRQVFDFLGYMWGPILANFFQIIFVIFGFFGVCQYRAKYTIAYSVWCFFWCCWNIFVICFYLDVGILDKESSLLNLGTGSVSWWESNGPGCKPVFHVNLTTIETVPPWLPPRPNSVTDCVILYHHLEALQASIHVALSILGLIFGISICKSLLEEDDSFDFMGALESKTPQHLALQPMYVRYTSVPTYSNSRLTLNRHYSHDYVHSSSSSVDRHTEPRVDADY